MSTVAAKGYMTFLGGDHQLTAARIRGTKALLMTRDRRIDRFDCLIPTIEDWHASMTQVYIGRSEISICSYSIFCYGRGLGADYTNLHLVLNAVQCISYAILSMGQMSQAIPKVI